MELTPETMERPQLTKAERIFARGRARGVLTPREAKTREWEQWSARVMAHKAPDPSSAWEDFRFTASIVVVLLIPVALIAMAFLAPRGTLTGMAIVAALMLLMR